MGSVESRTSIGRAVHLEPERAVLRPVADRDVGARHDLEPVANRLRDGGRQREHRLEHAADAVADRRALGAALDVHVAGADFDGAADDVIAQVDDRRSGRRQIHRAVGAFDQGPFPAQSRGEDVELAQLGVTALERFEQNRSLRHGRLHASAGRERQVALDLRVERTAGGVGQRAVVDAERDDDMAPREPLGHQAHGELARRRSGQVHERQPVGFGEKRVAGGLRHHPESHERLGELDVLAIRLLLRGRQVASADQASIEEQRWKSGAAERRGDSAESVEHARASQSLPAPANVTPFACHVVSLMDGARSLPRRGCERTPDVSRCGASHVPAAAR